MPSFPHQLRRARYLLVLAALLLVTAQCLPWERVPVQTFRIDISGFQLEGLGTAKSRLSPIESTWHFEHSDTDPVSRNPIPRVDVSESAIGRTINRPEDFPADVTAYQAVELGIFAKALASSSGVHLWYNRGASYLITCLLACIAVIAAPFLAAPLSRARPLLWLTRFCACSLFACLIRTLILIHPAHSERFLDRIGSGYWLSLAALAVEITALFLVPNAAKHHQRQSSQTCGGRDNSL